MRSAVARRASLPEGALSSIAVLLAAAALCVGCGSSSRSSTRAAPAPAKPSAPARAPVCRPAARGLVASALSVPVASVTAVAGEGSNAQPECRFSARLRSGHRVKVVANVDSAPQAYFRLERK